MAKILEGMILSLPGRGAKTQWPILHPNPGLHTSGASGLGLADDLEDAAPASEVDEGVDFAGVLLALVGKSLLGEGGGVVAVMLLEREVDEKGFADDGFAWDKAPVPAVFAVVAVVAHDEVVAGGNDEFAVVDQAAHANPPVRVDLRVGALETGEVVAEVVGWAGAVDGVGLDEGMAVDEDAAGVQAEAITRQADDALDEMECGVDGVVKDDDVATMDSGGRQKPGGVIRRVCEAVCLLTRRKSPTRRVDSIDSEGIRKGCAQKVMMKMAMTMR